MKGDFTRDTFKKEKHYSSVRMQQGRVQIDADWNEELDINSHRIETETIDVIGQSGAPIDNAGFKISGSGVDLLISNGNYYVSGILCENEKENLKLLFQPDIPSKNESNSLVTLSDGTVTAFPPAMGKYLIYLDVWRRHITALEDDEIRESALGGPDTATRIKNIWQVKLLQIDSGNQFNCLSDSELSSKLVTPSFGTLSARSEKDDASEDPCILPPEGGYRRLENQLYRVEIHKSGPRGTATFKWSRDNGMIVVNWTAQDGDNLTVSSLGKNKNLGFSTGQYVELFDDSNELYNTPGIFVKVDKAENNVITIDDLGQAINRDDFPDNPRIRRWDSEGEPVVDIPADNDGWIKVESGVEIKFTEGDYETGDYWLIPARTLKADVEWEEDESGNPVFEPPKGINHFYARLAIAEFDGNIWTNITDCRKLFPPLTELLSLFYISGDGQEAMPDVNNLNKLIPLPKSLKVGVSNGSHLIENASVKFKILKVEQSGQLVGGKVSADGINAFDEIIIKTNSEGIAECIWKLTAAIQSQQVKASLIDAGGNGIHLPVIFTANLSDASNVSFNPNNCSKWGNRVEIKTVEDALNTLCRHEKEGGCCAVKLNPDKNLFEIITQLIKDGERNICICASPGVHKIAGELTQIPEVNLHIKGCGPGTRFVLSKPLLFRSLSSLIIKDLEIESLQVDNQSPIQLLNCREVNFSYCSIRGIVNKGVLIQIGGADRIKLINNVIESYLKKELNNRIGIFNAAEFSNLFNSLNPVEFNNAANLISENLMNLSLTKRKTLTKTLKPGINELSPTEKTIYTDYISLLNTKNVNPAELVNSLNTIKESAFGESPGKSVAIMDARADTLIEGNEITGSLSLYGMQNGTGFTGDHYKLFKDLNTKLLELSEPSGNFIMQNNKVTRVVLSEEMVKLLIKIILAGKGKVKNIYNKCSFAGNSFLDGDNHFLARYLSLNSNDFGITTERALKGLSLAETSIFVGNHAPTRNTILFNKSKLAKADSANTLTIN